MLPATMGPAELVGINVRRIRRDSRLTQDALAAAVRKCGLPYTRSRLAKLERGERPDITLREFIVLCEALGCLPRDLLGADLETIQVAPNLPMLGHVLSGRFEGSRAVPMAEVVSVTYPHAAERDRLAAAGEAEMKAANALGTDPLWVAKVSYKRWGRSLTEERERRLQEAGANEGQAAELSARRGHITRVLIAELREHLAETRRRPSAGTTRRKR